MMDFIESNLPGLATVGVILGMAVGARYVYAPLKVRRTQTPDRSPQYCPVELAELPPDVSWTFMQGAAQLAKLGFTAVAHVVRNHRSQSGLHSATSLWVNRQDCSTAQMIAIRTTTQGGAGRLRIVAVFQTRFTDNTEIVTSNTGSPGIFPRTSTSDQVMCPGIHDLTLLYRLHFARVERDAPARTATIDAVSDGIAYLCNEHTATFQRLLNAGYYVDDAENDCYVPTYRGAYLMTYRLLWPWKQINVGRRRRKADRVLTELGFGGLDAMRSRQYTDMGTTPMPAATKPVGTIVPIESPS